MADSVQTWIDSLSDYGLGDDISSANLVSIINTVIQDVNSRQAWSFLQTTATVTLNAQQVTLPARFNKVLNLVIDAQSSIVVPEDMQTIRRKFVGSLTSTGTPRYYYFVGQSMFLYPTPDTSYSATMDFYQDEVVVTTSTLLSTLLCPVKHQDVYFLGTLARLFAIEDDTEMSALFTQRFEKKIVDMMEDVTMHQYDRPMHMIDVWDDGTWG